MKRTVFLLSILAIVGMTISCVDDDKDISTIPQEVPDVPLENYIFTTNFEVPTKEGNNTVVTYNGEVIYEGNYPTTLQIPKFTATTTRNSGLDWHFVPNNSSGNAWHYQISRSGILMFEDIPNGDNDYNDFVCRMEEQFQVNLDGNGNIRTENGLGLEFSKLGIYPIAMGNTLPLKLGVEIVNLATGGFIDDIIIFNDVRQECFDGVDSYINTDPTLEKFNTGNRNYFKFGGVNTIRYYPAIKENEFAINYYIMVNNVKYYTADSSKALATTNKVPYGLFIPNMQSFKYPIEKTSIFEAYPNLGKWLKGDDLDPFANPNTSLLYNK